jgi:signal transduction histidine kinase/CheY-like chemotaxis protein
MPIAPRYSLRWRLPTFVCAVVAAVLIAFLVVAYWRVEATLVHAAGDRAQAAADQVASILDGQRTIEQLRQLGMDPDFRRFLQDPIDANRDAALRRLRGLAGTGLRRVELWDHAGSRRLEISSADASGRVLPPASSPAVTGIAPLRSSGGTVFSETVAEIRDEASRTLGYVLTRATFVENPPGVFSRLVGGEAVVRVANKTGDVWADFGRVAPPLPVDLGRAGVVQYRRDDGELRLGAVAHIRSTPWAVWVGFPLATITAPAQTFLNQMILAAVFVLAVGAVVVSVLSARITRPLSELSGAAEAIASGDYARRVAAGRRDEIGRLGQAFNVMANEVESTHHRLEARVEERTAQLNAARQAADRANKAKSEFLSRMSHELRTPLNAIMGFAQVLELDSLSAEQMDAVHHILRGGRHLLGLINEVLDVARIEAGVLSLSPESVAVAELVHNAVELIQPLAAERHLTLEVEPVPDAHVLADRQRLNQILFNLLSNAVKYNREGGTVRVSSHFTEPNRVSIEVMDTGAGIPKEKLDLLFTPFERLGAEQSGIEGTGLGLALAKGLAEVMNGTLTVESVIDRGSNIRVELPAATKPGTHREAVVLRPPTDRGSVGTLLYIEDNLSNVSLMQRLVRRRPGVVLLHARDGRSGVTLVRDRRPDLVFLDLHLPDVAGEEVLRQIWENPATRAIPVVVLSADATPAQKRRLLVSGASGYLTKPFDIGEVLRVIDETLGPTS